MIRQRLTITGPQISAILGLERLIQATGLILVCPRCLEDGDASLETDNTPGQAEFKIDCGCRERRIAARDLVVAMDADGDLAVQAEAMLAPLSLSLRCPDRRCLRHPLDIEQTPDHTILRCRCAKTTLRLLPSVVH